MRRSLTAGKMLRQEGAFLRQSSPEPPSDKHRCLRDVPVGQTTTIAFHSLSAHTTGCAFEQIAELKFRADSSPPSAEPLKWRNSKRLPIWKPCRKRQRRNSAHCLAGTSQPSFQREPTELEEKLTQSLYFLWHAATRVEEHHPSEGGLQSL